MKNQEQAIVTELMDFIANSPTQFHAVEQMKKMLEGQGFQELQEKEAWKLKAKGTYYVIRGDSSIAAFRIGSQAPAETGFSIIGAHTDSPGLKVKPSPEKKFKNYISLGVEVYGGPLLSTWFDRDLSIAGQVAYIGTDGELHSQLVDFKRPLALIPNLAIHLNRNANKGWEINKQKELPPILLQMNAKEMDEKFDFRELLKQELNKSVECSEVLDFELYFYDTQKPARVGFNQEFVTAARLDNLLNCFTGLKALLDSDSEQTCLLICNDHEEVGSESATGAAGTFLKYTLQRICGDQESFQRAIASSYLLSADNAHGIHPNYMEKHDSNHGPLLNAGPVIKINSNQRYATNNMTSSRFQMICKKAEVPLQKFVVRSDMGCGSTIGPITATLLGIQTLDIGAPTFAMHSIRETCGAHDIWYTYRALQGFFS